MTDTQSTERLGINRCEFFFVKSNFIFREQTIADYGIDAIIETKEKDHASGKLIALQIKSGSSYFTEETKDYIVYRIDNKHRDYWINHSLPVIIVLYDERCDECFWELVNKQTLVSAGTRWKIHIPKKQTIQSSYERLYELAFGMSEYEHRRASLAVAREWMIEARKRGQLILEVGEWVNKSSGMGQFVLKSYDENGNEVVFLDRTLWGFGTKSYDLVIREMFPWATVSVDKDFYDEYMELDDNINWDIFDKDDDIIIPKKRHLDDGIYPYRNTAGEVDWYRLIITLNHIGNAYLTTEEFLENANFYTIDHLK